MPFDPIQQERMYQAARDGRTEDVLDAAANGAELNRPDGNGMTALHLAVFNDQDDTVIQLCQLPDIDLNVTNKAGATPLVLAFTKQRTNLQVALTLIEEGASPTAQGDRVEPPLHSLTKIFSNPKYPLDTMYALVPFLEKALEAGADPNRQFDGESPMHLLADSRVFTATSQGSQNGGYNAVILDNVLPLMVAYGGDTNQRSEKDNRTPTQIASEKNNISFNGFYSFMHAGADAWLPNHRGDNLFSCPNAQENQHVRFGIARYEKIPHFAETPIESITKESLFKRNGNSACLLDDPITWHHFDEVAAQLESRGERLTLEDLKNTTLDANIPAITMAAKCFSLGSLCRHLARHGEAIPTEWLEESGEEIVPKLTSYMGQNRQVTALFQDEVLKEIDATSADIRDLASALPENLRTQVKNLHGLTVQADRRAQAEQRLR